jgi:hypothetical protein
MLPAAGRVAGSVAAVTVKALFELLNCAICTGDVLGFVIDTVLSSGVPMVTSPKSMLAGLICSATAAEPVDENGLEFEPQPDRARPNAIAAMLKAKALPAIVPRNLLSVWVACDRFSVRFLLITKSKILRNSHIRHHLCPKESVSRCGERSLPKRGNKTCMVHRLTSSRIDPGGGPVQVTIVTNVVCTDYLCTTFAKHCIICV